MVVDRPGRRAGEPAELLRAAAASTESVSQSTVDEAYASASAARTIVGATDPRARRIERVGPSTARHAPAMAITIALRMPTLAYPCQPSSTGTVTAMISSSGRRAVRLTPVMNSPTGSSRRPAEPSNSTTASRADRTGRPSPAGEQVARLPPIVAALRICGEPTVRAAWASAGSRAASGGASSSA